MTFEKTYDLKNNELTIKLPIKFKSIKKVRVIIEEVQTERDKKLKLLKKASSDPLFNADSEAVTQEFSFSDNEEL